MTNLGYKELRDGFRHQVRMFGSLGRAEMLEVVLDFFDAQRDMKMAPPFNPPPKASWQK